MIAEGDTPNQPIPNPDTEGGPEEPDVPSPNEKSNSIVIPIPAEKLIDSGLLEGLELELYSNSSPASGDQKGPDGREPPSQGSEFGVKLVKNVSEKSATPFKIGIGIRLFGHQVRLRSHVVYQDGSIDQEASQFTIAGLEMMNVGFLAGSEDGIKDALKLRFEYTPNFSFPIGGSPFVVTIGCKFSFETALSSKNSTVWGHGAYKLTGNLGVVGGAAEAPTITVKTPIMDNLGGVSLTPLGLVFGAEPKLMFGVGIYRVVTAGPYAKGRFSVGIAMGSILGSPLAVCRGVTWKIDAGLGLGMTFMHGVTDKLTDYLKITNPEGEVELLEHMYPVWSPPTSTLPDTALCRGD